MNSYLPIGEIVRLKAGPQVGWFYLFFAKRFNSILSNSNACYTPCVLKIPKPPGARNIQQHPCRLQNQLTVISPSSWSIIMGAKY